MKSIYDFVVYLMDINISCLPPYFVVGSCFIVFLLIQSRINSLAIKINIRYPAKEKEERWLFKFIRPLWEFIKLLTPKELTRYAKNPQIILWASSSYVMLGLTVIYLLYAVIYTLPYSKITVSQIACTHLFGDMSHLPNFVFVVFGTIATLSAAILAFCLVTLDYKEITKLGQISHMIDTELSTLPRERSNKFAIRFAVQDRGMLFGILSDTDSWESIFASITELWRHNSKDKNAESYIIVSCYNSLKSYFQASLTGMTQEGKNKSAAKLLEVLEETDMAFDGSGSIINDLKSLLGNSSQEESVFNDSLASILSDFNSRIIGDAKRRGVKVKELKESYDEKYICFGGRACAYYVLPNADKSKAANRIQGFITNESALVNFFFDMIEKKYKNTADDNSAGDVEC